MDEHSGCNTGSATEESEIQERARRHSSTRQNRVDMRGSTNHVIEFDSHSGARILFELLERNCHVHRRVARRSDMARRARHHANAAIDIGSCQICTLLPSRKTCTLVALRDMLPVAPCHAAVAKEWLRTWLFTSHAQQPRSCFREEWLSRGPHHGLHTLCDGPSWKQGRMEAHQPSLDFARGATPAMRASKSSDVEHASALWILGLSSAFGTKWNSVPSCGGTMGGW